MTSKEFSEILELSKKSGGKYIIVEEGKPSYVLMDVKEYKKMASNEGNIAIEDMSKEELIEKINRDIAIWHSSKDEEEKGIDDHFLSGDSSNNNTKDEAQYLYEDLDDEF
jgi:prevent-host-death family protein